MRIVLFSNSFKQNYVYLFSCVNGKLQRNTTCNCKIIQLRMLLSVIFEATPHRRVICKKHKFRSTMHTIVYRKVNQDIMYKRLKVGIGKANNTSVV